MDAAADLVADSALGGAFESMSKRFLVDAEEVDEDELTLFAEAERRALSRLGSTVYELLINYVQLATIISAHPAAGFWTNHWAFSWMRWLSVDFFSAFSLPGSHPALTIQVQLAVMLCPCCLLLYISEYFWRDHAKWRRLYVDEWQRTRRQLSPMDPLNPAFPQAVVAVNTCCLVMVFATPASTTTVLSVAIVFFLVQSALGAIVLVGANVARVIYGELRNDETVDERAQFFYNVRRQCRHLGIVGLNTWYLPLAVGMFTAINTVRHHIQIGTLYEGEDASKGSQYDTILLTLVSIQVIGMGLGFIFGVPRLMSKLVRKRMERFHWVVPTTGTKVGPDGNEEEEEEEEENLKEKGVWLWKAELEKGDDNRTLFEISDRLDKMNQIFGRLTWLERTGMDALLPDYVADMLLPASHSTLRVDAVKRSMDKLRVARDGEWARGMDLHDRDHPQEKGVDALWMCSRSGMAQWKIATNYIEKGLMFLFANGLAASLIAPGRCGLISSVNTNNLVDSGNATAEINGTGWLDMERLGEYTDTGIDRPEWATDMGPDMGSWSRPSLLGDQWRDDDDVCAKGGAVGLLVVACIALVAEAYARPYLNDQEDLVEGLCRFASVAMSFALVVMQFELSDNVYLIASLLVIPSVTALSYATYVLNPGVVVEHIVNEFRLFLHKRKIAHEQEAERDRIKCESVYQAARMGNSMKLRHLLQKYDQDLDFNWAANERDEDDPERGFTPFHVAAAHGNSACLEELFASGLFQFNQRAHTTVLTPLQLAWKNGCGQCVNQLEEMGFEELNLDAKDPLLRASGVDLLHGNIVAALIAAGHHAERGLDMAWILNHQGNPEQNTDHHVEDLDQRSALKMVFASLVLEHQWDGLAALAAAIELTVLELWDEWVSFQVISQVARVAPGIHCLKVDGATISVGDLERVACTPEFAHCALVFHGTPSITEEPADAADGVKHQPKTARWLVKRFAYGETSWSIAGISRLLEYLQPGGKHVKQLKTFLDDLHELDSPSESDFQPHLKERPPVGGKQYRSHPFSTDESDDPHQWVLVLENWGGELAVLIQYIGRGSDGVNDGADHITASFTITCTAEKKLLYPGCSISVKSQRFQRGDNMHIATLRMDNVPKDLIELRVLDSVVSETMSLTPDCIDWRMTGVNVLMDTETLLFSDVFKATGADEPWQMSLQIPEQTLPESAMFNLDEAYFERAGLPLPLPRFDAAMKAVILKAFSEFADDEKLLAMALASSCDSSARKFCHQTAAEKSLEHSTQTDDGGARSVHVFKPNRQDHVPIEAFLRRCDTPNDDEWSSGRLCTVALRLEHESTQQNASHCLGHVWTDVGDARSVGCQLGFRRDLQRGDRTEVVHLKLLFVPETSCRPQRSEGHPWTPDEKERAWMMELLRDQAAQKHQHAQVNALRVLIGAEDLTFTDELLWTMLSALEECTAVAGTVLLEQGAPCDEFMFLLEGDCSSDSGGSVLTGPVQLNRLCDMVVGLGVTNRRTILAQSRTVKYLRLDAATALAARFAGVSPITFPEPAYDMLSPADMRGGGIADSTWLWTLHKPEQLLGTGISGATVSLASAWFSIPTVTSSRWRLHLITDGSETATAALYLGCERASTMPTTQQMRTGFITSLGSGAGDFKGLQSGNLQKEGEYRYLARQLAALGQLAPGERLWGGVRIPCEDLVVNADRAVLQLELTVPVARESGFGLAATTRNMMVAKRGLGGIGKRKTPGLAGLVVATQASSGGAGSAFAAAAKKAAASPQMFEAEFVQNPLAFETENPLMRGTDSKSSSTDKAQLGPSAGSGGSSGSFESSSQEQAETGGGGGGEKGEKGKKPGYLKKEGVKAFANPLEFE